MTYEDEVTTAFDILLEEIDDVVVELSQDIAEAGRKSDQDLVSELVGKLSRVVTFPEKASGLQKEWEGIFAKDSSRKRRRKRTKRLPRGKMTPQSVFRIPILQALVQMGGSAPGRKVLARVGDLIESKLNKYDRMSYPGGGIRWRKAARFARSNMVKEGLVASDSPRGIWEITEKGKQWLATQTTQT